MNRDFRHYRVTVFQIFPKNWVLLIFSRLIWSPAHWCADADAMKNLDFRSLACAVVLDGYISVSRVSTLWMGWNFSSSCNYQDYRFNTLFRLIFAPLFSRPLILANHRDSCPFFMRPIISKFYRFDWYLFHSNRQFLTVINFIQQTVQHSLSNLPQLAPFFRSASCKNQKSLLFLGSGTKTKCGATTGVVRWKTIRWHHHTKQ